MAITVDDFNSYQAIARRKFVEQKADEFEVTLDAELKKGINYCIVKKIAWETLKKDGTLEEIRLELDARYKKSKWKAINFTTRGQNEITVMVTK